VGWLYGVMMHVRHYFECIKGSFAFEVGLVCVYVGLFSTVIVLADMVE